MRAQPSVRKKKYIKITYQCYLLSLILVIFCLLFEWDMLTTFSDDTECLTERWLRVRVWGKCRCGLEPKLLHVLSL